MKKRSSLSIMVSLVVLMESMLLPMIAAILLGTLGHLAAISIPVLGSLILYSFSQGESVQLYTILLIASGVLRGFLRYGEQSLNHYIAFKLLAKIRHEVFKKLRTLAPAKLDEKDRGQIIATVTKDVELLEVFYAHTLSPIAIAVLVSVIMLTFIVSFAGMYAIISLVSYLLVGAVLPMIVYKYGGQSADLKRASTSEINARLLEMSNSYESIMEYDADKKSLDSIISLNSEIHNAQRRLSHYTGINRVLTELSVIGGAVMYLVLAQGIGLSALIVVTVAHLSSFGPLISLSNLSSDLVHTFAAGRRVLDLLDEEPVIQSYGSHTINDKSTVSVENISFAYVDEDVLNDVSIQFKPGTIYGIEGASGSGKSTLLKLIMRYWDSQNGSIRFDSTSIADITNDSLRSYESSMSQTTEIMTGTIYHNIASVNANATKEDVVEAAKKASIHDFIMSLPEGYQTLVDKKSSFLSAGERQRLALARMFCHDGEMFILDEPTSNIDSLNEALILKSLYASSKDKLVVLVSHRPSTLTIANQRYMMDSGKLTTKNSL